LIHGQVEKMADTTLEYADGAAICRGYLVHETHAKARPGVVLFPDARGLGDAVKDCARRLAGHGFVALAADLYGEGTFTHEMQHAMYLMNDLRSELTRWRHRARAALDALARHPAVNSRKLAAVGYCFGGSTALELARSGAPLGAVISFHGGLASPKPEDAVNIKARVLVCHGADDPLVPPAQVADFAAQMCKTSVDWQIRAYGGVVHGFTNPEADNAGTPALAYNADADRRSWRAMLELFRDTFGTSP
jgi:dienelactone hydrolase